VSCPLILHQLTIHESQSEWCVISSTHLTHHSLRDSAMFCIFHWHSYYTWRRKMTWITLCVLFFTIIFYSMYCFADTPLVLHISFLIRPTIVNGNTVMLYDCRQFNIHMYVRYYTCLSVSLLKALFNIYKYRNCKWHNYSYVEICIGIRNL